jgi:hypothetical protein
MIGDIPNRRRRRRSVDYLAVAIAVLLGAVSLSGQDQVQIVVPTSVAFQVLDVAASTVAGTNPSTMSFSSAVLQPGQVLRISVKADSDLAPPSGTAIPASNVSWSTSSVVNGVGSNGVLSKTVYTQVFQSQVGVTSGGVDLNWTLSAPGIPLRAGTHQVSLRWKLEAIVP